MLYQLYKLEQRVRSCTCMTDTTRTRMLYIACEGFQQIIQKEVILTEKIEGKVNANQDK